MLGSVQIAGGGGSYAWAGERLGAGGATIAGDDEILIGAGLADGLCLGDGFGEGLGDGEGDGATTPGVLAAADGECDATTTVEGLGEGPDTTTRWFGEPEAV